MNYEVDPGSRRRNGSNTLLYVEHGDKRFGPYAPVGGPIPLYRYRAFKNTSTQQCADRIEALAELQIAGHSQIRRSVWAKTTGFGLRMGFCCSCCSRFCA